jgi:hypothetical protein
MKDRADRNRNARGSLHGKSKLVESEVLAIRLMWETKKHLQNELASIFRITPMQVNSIIHKRTWNCNTKNIITAGTWGYTYDPV